MKEDTSIQRKKFYIVKILRYKYEVTSKKLESVSNALNKGALIQKNDWIRNPLHY